jgi:hypothetical protein
MTSLFYALLVLAGAYVIAMNWGCIFANLRNAREGIDKHHSFSPIVGPLLVVVGLSKLAPDLGWFLVLPIVVDPATWILVYGLPFLAKQLVGGRD